MSPEFNIQFETYEAIVDLIRDKGGQNVYTGIGTKVDILHGEPIVYQLESSVASSFFKGPVKILATDGIIEELKIAGIKLPELKQPMI